MAKHKPTELEIMQARYDELTHNLQMYRKQYFQLQDQYPPESEYLIQQLTRLDNVLAISRSEITEFGSRITALRDEQQKAKVKKRHVFLRRVG